MDIHESQDCFMNENNKMNNKVVANDLTLVWEAGVSKIGDEHDVELVERSNARQKI
jgi:hypothetical protein